MDWFCGSFASRRKTVSRNCVGREEESGWFSQVKWAEDGPETRKLVGLNKCGFTPYDILAFFGPLVFSVFFLPHMTFGPFLGPPPPLH